MRLGPQAAQIMLCEGVEDGLSLMRVFPGTAVWVALGAGNIAHVALPPCVRRVIVAGDEDGPGVLAVDAARAAFEGQGRAVGAIYPGYGFRDFNAQLAGSHRP